MFIFKYFLLLKFPVNIQPFSVLTCQAYGNFGFLNPPAIMLLHYVVL
jgi:hypothetical protein